MFIAFQCSKRGRLQWTSLAAQLNVMFLSVMKIEHKTLPSYGKVRNSDVPRLTTQADMRGKTLIRSDRAYVPTARASAPIKYLKNAPYKQLE